MYLALALAARLTMIGALEGIQHIFDSSEGFFSVGRSSAIVFATFIPAIVVLTATSMYAEFVTMAAIFAPFTTLKKSHCMADRTRHFKVIGRSLPVACFRAVKVRHYALAILVAANLVALFLSIVISGLDTVIEFDSPREVGIHCLDNFNLNDAKLPMQDSHAASIDSLICYTELTYSQWTWEGLTFSRYEQNEFSPDQLHGHAPLAAIVQALRPGLTCSVVPAKDSDITQVKGKQNPGSYVKLPYQNEYWTPIPGQVTVGFNTTMSFSDYCETSAAKNES